MYYAQHAGKKGLDDVDYDDLPTRCSIGLTFLICMEEGEGEEKERERKKERQEENRDDGFGAREGLTWRGKKSGTRPWS